MAMKVKSGLTPALEALVDLTSVDTLVGKGVQGVNTLSVVIKKVTKETGSKYKPRIDRVKPVNKDSHLEAKGVVSNKHTPKKPTMPVLGDGGSEPSANQDDSANLAAWLEFHTPIKTKVISYPIDPKEKARCKNASRESRKVKQHIQNLKAVGVTPRAHVGKAEPITKNVDPSWKYFKEEVLVRHLERVSMERELVDKWVAVSTDVTYDEEHYDGPEMEIIIERLENHINESSSEPVEFVGPMPVADTIDQRELPCDLIERQSYGLELSDDQRYYHWLQVMEGLDNRPTVIDYFDNKLVSKHRKYIHALVHCANNDWKRYATWLSTYGKDSTYVRNYQEQRDKEANPYHELNIGEDIHPLAQFAPKSFEWSMQRMQAQRQSNIYYEQVGCDYNLSRWQHYLDHKYPTMPVSVTIDKAAVVEALNAEESRKEEFAQRIIDHATRKQSGFRMWSQNINLGRTRMQMLRSRIAQHHRERYESDSAYQFFSWSTNVVPEVLEKLNVPWEVEGDDGMATVTIDLAPANDATVVNSPAELPVSAEVVDLASVRNKQSNEVLSLSSKLKARLTERINSMSDEELKVVEQLFKAE